MPAAREVWPQVTPRPLTMQFTMADPYSLNTGKVFGELMQGDREARIAAYRDPDVAGAGRGGSRRVADEAALGDVRSLRVGRSFPSWRAGACSDLARERDCGPLDVLCEIAVAEDLETRFRAYIANDDVAAVGHLLTHDHVALGLSDAGAHVDQLCDAPLPTDLLGTWVRERQVMPLEQAVRKLTGEAGRHVRLRAPRATCARATGPTCACSIRRPWAPGPTRRVRDFPADGERLTAEEPTGVRHVLVNGTPIRRDGAQLDTQRLAGHAARARVIEHFRIDVDDAVLDDLRRRLEHTRLPDEIDARRLGVRDPARLPARAGASTGATPTTGARTRRGSTSSRSSAPRSTASRSTSCTRAHRTRARCRC